jgi:hypothetical protein
MTEPTKATVGKGMRFRYQEPDGAPAGSGFGALRISDNNAAFSHSSNGKPVYGTRLHRRLGSTVPVPRKGGQTYGRSSQP